MNSADQVASRFLAKQAGGSKDALDASVDYLAQSVDSIQAAVDMLTARQGSGISGIGVGEQMESAADAYGPVARAVQNLQRIMAMVNGNRKVIERISQQMRTAGKGARMDNTLRQRMNRQISKLITNNYFERATQGWSAIVDILQSFDIEIDGIIDSHIFTREDGSARMDLAFTNREDPMSPVPIGNAMLVFSFHEMQSGRFEITAYVS